MFALLYAKETNFAKIARYFPSKQKRSYIFYFVTAIFLNNITFFATFTFYFRGKNFYSISVKYSFIRIISSCFTSSMLIPSTCAPANVICPPPPSFSKII